MSNRGRIGFGRAERRSRSILQDLRQQPEGPIITGGIIVVKDFQDQLNFMTGQRAEIGI